MGNHSGEITLSKQANGYGAMNSPLHIYMPAEPNLLKRAFPRRSYRDY